MADSAEAFERLDPDNFLDVDLDGDEMRQNWLDHVPAWAQRPPFYVRDRYGRVRAVCARYADVRDVQWDKGERFSVVVPNRPGYEDFDFFMGVTNVAQTDGVDHDRMRRLLARPFGAAALAAFEPKLREIVSQMLDGVEAKAKTTGGFDAMSDFCSHVIAQIVLVGMLGLQHEQLAAFYEMNVAFEHLVNMEPGHGFPEPYVKAFHACRDTVAALVEERRAHPGDDVLSSMVHARDGDDFLSTDELVGNLFAIAAAALTTTSNSLAMALYNLCRHPDQLAALQADPSLIASALEECLRYQGPGYLSFVRFAAADTEVGGVRIPKGMAVEISQQAANMDPAQFPDPLRFDIFRKPAAILTFGSGPHLCVGFQIARAIMRVSLEEIIRRFPRLRLAEPDVKVAYHGMHGELAPVAVPFRVD